MDTSSSNPARRPRLAGWLLLAPLLAWLLLFVIAPTLILAVFSLCGRDELGQIVYAVTTENYSRLATAHQTLTVLWAALTATVVAVAWRLRLRRAHPLFWPGVLIVFWAVLNVLALCPADADADAPDFLKITVISINYAALSTAACVVLAYPAAYFIGRCAPGWRNGLVLAVTIPFWTSFLVRTYAWVTILRDGGAMNSVLLTLRIIHEPIHDLYPSTTAVMIGLVYTYLPFMVLPIYTSVERLDGALIEASLDLGASPLRTFTRVILPLTRPGIVAGVVLTFVPAVGMFAVNDILGGRQQTLIGNVIERQFTAARDKPFGATLGMVLLGLFVATYAVGLRRRDASD